MVEMAGHIGAYLTLVLIDRYGGQQLSFTQAFADGPLAELLGAEAAATLRQVYRGERVFLPTGRRAIAYAKRQPILAAVRANLLTGQEATRILRTSRTYVSYLLHETTEGTGVVPPPEFRARRRAVDPRQIDMFGDDQQA
ncbi:hypothetical protein GVO57_07330 [Sphingomonas changnyeongensis]|uniref:Mor transcription activator domain-containing protein n=1 Tax=Sphingomonas changnyeongensis TaxID=2698679 RepID=A0A7Z2NWU4_9SPHN|nr:hypothetical protein [Sphingomonas changnyeongensis]QHL90679.1 hypothetical protein GVO57_07330 [Sphingomonas changnyeongensis]